MELHFERGRIRAIVPTTDHAVVIRNETSSYEFPGATVLPGFVDNHLHLMGLGQRLMMPSLHAATSPSECVEILRRAHEQHSMQWLRSMGWNQELWSPASMPDSHWLDDAFPDVPVVASRVDGHAFWVNAEASRRAGVPHRPVVVDTDMDPFWAAIPKPDAATITTYLETAAAYLSAFGITEIHDMDVAPHVVEVLRSLVESGRFPIRVQSFVSAQHDEWESAGLLPAAGEIQRTAGLKLFADGALGSRGAALLAPYTDDPSTSGLLLKTSTDIAAAARKAIDAGWWCLAVHAIGDAAVREVLDAYTIVRSWPDGQDLLLRIEHAQHMHASDVSRCAELGVFACVQPSHCTSDAAMAERRLGHDRLADAYRWRSLLDAGVRVAAGSDAPIESASVLAGLADFVQRPWQQQERLTMAEALEAYGRTAHASADVDYRRGTIALGFDADVVVLDRDPMTCPADELTQIRVLATFMAGQCRFLA